jgi:hypothetical protein
MGKRMGDPKRIDPDACTTRLTVAAVVGMT